MGWITPDDVRGGDLVEIWAIRASKEDAAEGVIIAWTDLDNDTYEAMLDRAARHHGYSVSSRDFLETRSRDLCMQQQQQQVRVTQRTLMRARNLPGLPLQIRTFARTQRTLASFPCDSPESVVTVKVRRIELRMHANAKLVFETRSSAAKGSFMRRAFIEIQVPSSSSFGVPEDLMRTVDNSVRVVFLGQQGKRGSFTHRPPHRRPC
jgi:hypothetical protein